MEANESISLIHEMINRSRRRISENGKLYLFWGWLSLVLSISHYVLHVHFELKYAYAVWSGSLIGYVYQFLILKKQSQTTQAETFIDTAMKSVWSAFLFGMIVVLVSMPAFKYQPYPWFILLYGIATFISGGLLKSKALQIGGFSNFIFAGIAMYVSVENQLLVLPLSIICSYIIPGYVLKRNPVAHV